MNFTIAKILGAIDTKFGQQYNYLIDLLSTTFSRIPYYGGTATVYNDINTGINPRNVGLNRPTLAPWLGNIQQFQFAVNDFADMTPIELLHGWKEGSEVEIHCHWCTGGTNDATRRGVKWEVEYSYAPKGSVSLVYITPVVASVESIVLANEPANTAHYTSITRFTPVGYKIGTQIGFRIKRIASVTNPAPVANPFLMSVGVHYIQDSLGSRMINAK